MFLHIAIWIVCCINLSFRIIKLEEENKAANANSKQFSKEKFGLECKVSELEKCLEHSKCETDSAKQDLIDYRLKALKILQVRNIKAFQN